MDIVREEGQALASIRAPRPLTPRRLLSQLAQHAGHLVNPQLPLDSPLFLPVLPVEPSPTTGIQHCIPPLFHSTTATRSAFANVANKNAASAVTEAPIRQVPQEALSSPLGMKREQLPLAEAGGSGPVTSNNVESWGSGHFPAGSMPQAFSAGPEAHLPPLPVPYIQPQMQKMPGKQSVANHDGWQWRKYGEKIVKGSPNPRSYYKCSHQGCVAKKIVERTEHGDIVNTEYKGDHSHPAPASVKSNRYRPKSQARAMVSHIAPTPHGSTVSHEMPPPDMPVHGMAAPMMAGPPIPILQGPDMSLLPIPDALRSNLHGGALHVMFAGGHGDDSIYDAEADHDDKDDGSQYPDDDTQGPSQGHEADIHQFPETPSMRRLREQESAPVESPSKRLDALAAYAEEAEREYKGEGIGFEGPLQHQQPAQQQFYHTYTNPAKRQRMDISGNTDQDDSMSGGSQEVQQAAYHMQGYAGQRVIETDTVEDGYKWRKYGQKSVKGSPYPRSYYKCTWPNCPVRKHVERSVNNRDLLLITYEGQHTHSMPLSGSGRRTPTKGAVEYEDQSFMEEDDSVQPSPRSYGSIAHPAVVLSTVHSGPPLHMSPENLQDQLLPFMQSLPPPAAVRAPVPQVHEDVKQASSLLGTLGALGNMTIEQFTQMLSATNKNAGSEAAAAWDPLMCLVTPKIANSSPLAKGALLLPLSGQKAGGMSGVEAPSVALPIPALNVPDMH